MRQLAKKPIIIIWMICLLLSLFLLASKGIALGVDFSGGTAFQIVLEEPVESSDLSQITSIISRRLDWAGLKDAKVNAAGNQYVVAQLAESDPEEISSLKNKLLKQGKFEAMIDSEILFVGEDIITIFKDQQKGYRVDQIDRSGTTTWNLPFMLSPKASDSFAKKVFHRCSAIGFNDNQVEYDCEKTYFFVDRPKDSIIVMDNELYLAEQEVSTSPGRAYTDYVPIENIISQINTNHYIVDGSLTTEQLTTLNQDFNNYQKAVVASTVDEEVINKLEEIGFKVTVIENDYSLTPWIWKATGLKSVIGLTAGVANMDAQTTESSNFETFKQLTISGSGDSLEEAQERLDELVIILESGSLPVGIESISTESISPYLGKDFLNNSLWIALYALLTVAIILFFRYRLISISLPILIAGASEIIILLGLFSLIGFRLDLAAVAGILATIGTGVDHKIIITDELLKGNKKENAHESLMSKIKKAFFIVFAAAATTTATMLPIIFFSIGLSKLVGFVITIIFGALIGIVLTRPAYAEVAKKVVSNVNKNK